MGRAIEAEALAKGHEVVLRIDNDDDWQRDGKQLAMCDVALEFSTPATAVANIGRCFSAGVPVVVGTTGWNAQRAAVESDCRACGGGLFVASNFSIGMNILFALNRRLAAVMSGHREFAVSVEEVHHIHKLDKPSGTAITIAEDIVQQNSALHGWQLVGEGLAAADEVPVVSVREGEVPGIHTVCYKAENECVSIRHELFNRRALAQGALVAAEFMVGKRGCYSMADLVEAPAADPR